VDLPFENRKVQKIMNIWMKLPGKSPEKIDECAVGEVAFMLREYNLVYQSYPGTLLWAGRRKDCPCGPSSRDIHEKLGWNEKDKKWKY